MSDDPSAEPIHRHKRPLDPPNCREEVIARAAAAKDFCIIIDSDDDFETGFRGKRLRISDDIPLSTVGTVISERNTTSSTPDSEIPISDSSMTVLEALHRESSEQLPCPSNLAKDIMSNEPFPESRPETCLHLPSPQTSDILPTDEGDVSLEHSAAQLTFSITGDQREHDMETSIHMARLIAESNGERDEHAGERGQHSDRQVSHNYHLTLEMNKVAWEQQGQAAIRTLRSKNLATNENSLDKNMKASTPMRAQPVAPAKSALSQLAERHQSVDSEVERDHAIADDPAVHEKLLDMAQQHGKAQRVVKEQSRGSRKRNRRRTSDLLQALRAVSEGHHTPICHIENQEGLRRQRVGGDAAPCNQRERTLRGAEHRLRELAGRHHQHSVQDFPFTPILTPSPHSDKMSSPPLCREGEEMGDAHQDEAQCIPQKSSQPCTEDSNEVAECNAQAPDDECKADSLSVLERLVIAQKQQEPEPVRLKSVSPRPEDSRTCSQPSRIVAGYPPQGEILALPKTFLSFDEKTLAIIKKHETLKDRRRDLHAIKAAFEEIARLGCVASLKKTQEQEVIAVHEFATKIIDEALSGSKKRARITSITGNFKRRVNRIDIEPDPACVEALLQNMMAPGHAEKIEAELATLDSEIEEIGAARFAQTTMRTNSGNKTTRSIVKSDKTSTQRVRFGRTTLIPHPELVNEKLSKSERSIKAYKDSLNREEILLRSKLALFNRSNVNVDEACQVNSQENPLRDQNAAGNSDSELRSEFSEEDEGAEFMRPLGFHHTDNQGLVIDNGQSDEFDRQTEEIQEGATLAISTQQADLELVMRMKQKEHNHSLGAQMQSQTLLQEQLQRPERQHSTEENNGELEDRDVGAREFDDETDDDEDEEYVDDEERVVYRYLVKAVFKGVPDCEDNNEYCFGKYLSLKKAGKQMSDLVKGVLEQYKQLHEDISDPYYQQTVMVKDGLEEWKLELGPDSQVCGRVWLEKEFHTLSHEMYQKAKFRKACTAKPIYTVEWMKTIKQVLEEEQVMEKTLEGEIHANAEPTTENHHTNHHEDAETVTEPVENANHETQTHGNQISAIEQRETSSANNEEILLDSERFNNTKDNLDDLFGREDTPSSSLDSNTQPVRSCAYPSSSPTPITQAVAKITRIDLDDVQHYSSIAVANRNAKDLFCTWWHSHLRGEQNFKYIREEEMYMEQALEACGDRQCWQREEDFDFIEQGKDGEEKKMNEKFRVWVRTIPVKGPGN